MTIAENLDILAQEFTNLRRRRRNISSLLKNKLELSKEPRNLQEIESVLRSYEPINLDKDHIVETMCFEDLGLKVSVTDLNFIKYASTPERVYIAVGKYVFFKKDIGAELIYTSDDDERITSIFATSNHIYIYCERAGYVDVLDEFKHGKKKRISFSSTYLTGQSFTITKDEKYVVLANNGYSSRGKCYTLLSINDETLENYTREDYHDAETYLVNGCLILFFNDSPKRIEVYFLESTSWGVRTSNLSREYLRDLEGKNIVLLTSVVERDNDDFVIVFTTRESLGADGSYIYMYKISKRSSSFSIEECTYSGFKTGFSREVNAFSKQTTGDRNEFFRGVHAPKEMYGSMNEKKNLYRGFAFRSRFYPKYKESFMTADVKRSPSGGDYPAMVVCNSYDRPVWYVLPEKIPNKQGLGLIFYKLNKDDFVYDSKSYYREIRK